MLILRVMILTLAFLIVLPFAVHLNLTGSVQNGVAVPMLSGPIPSEIGNLFLLESLALGNNAFDGIIPTELGQLAAIRTSLKRCSLCVPRGLF